MQGRPEPSEAAQYYFRYIDRISSSDILAQLEGQLPETLAFLESISEERSLHRYAPDRWSIRQVLNHVTDSERAFLFRAFWFARNFDTPLPSFDQNVCSDAAKADEFCWASHIEDFRSFRLSALAFFRNLPAEAWMKTGIASGNPFSVRALAYIVGGHLAHHRAILEERYLGR